MPLPRPNFTYSMESPMGVTLPMEGTSLPPWQKQAIDRQNKPSQCPFTTPKHHNRRNTAACPPRPSTRKTMKKGDRFIPSRGRIDLDICRLQLTTPSSNVENNNNSNLPQNEKYRETLAVNLFGSSKAQQQPVRRILSFDEDTDVSTRDNRTTAFKSNQLHYRYKGNDNDTNAYNSKPYRNISSSPSRILDAPELRDDYYLNLLSWNSDKVLAVALNQTVYLWNADTGSIDEIHACTGTTDYVTSVSWLSSSNTLAIGTDSAQVQLWDASSVKKTSTLTGHDGRVGSLAYNPSLHLLSSGSRDSLIYNHDIRSSSSSSITSTYRGHQQEVCGLTWSPDGNTLASGGNDNLLCLWDKSTTTTNNNSNPRSILRGHQAAVKALAWCPWERHTLASGGGTADRTIKFWNTSITPSGPNSASTSSTTSSSSSTTPLLSSIDTNSQVCGLLWSLSEKEILSSHGFSHYQLCLWKYPTMTKVKELKGHTARVLHMAMSPDGSQVVSAAADETLRFWDIFPATHTYNTKSCCTSSSSSNALMFNSEKYGNIGGIR